MTPILFDGWTGLFRVVIVGTCAYVALLLILRVSGKRTLAKLSAFDFVVTIALGCSIPANANDGGTGERGALSAGAAGTWMHLAARARRGSKQRRRGSK